MSDLTSPGDRVRKFRKGRTWSLDYLADLIAEKGVKRPSAAKLSRIETGQPVPLDVLPAISQITGIPERELRPDLAEMAARLLSQEVAA